VRRLGLKARLTLWHGAIVAVILLVTLAAAERWLTDAVYQQVDAALLALAETEVASALDSPGDEVHLHETAPGSPNAALRRLDKLVQLIDPTGGIVDRSATLGGATLPVSSATLAGLHDGDVVIETVSTFAAGEPVRMVSLPIEVDGRLRYALQVGTSLRPAADFIRLARLLFGAAAIAILAGVIVTGAWLSRRALLPVDRIVAMARRIGDTTLGQRLPHPGTGDELGRLVTTLNEMLERIEKNVEAQRRFTADASHELRSPLSRLRTELDIALRRPRSAAQYEDVLRSCLDEVERLSELTEDLLVLTRLDAGERDRAREPVDVMPVVEEALEHLAPEIRTRQVTTMATGDRGAAVAVPRALLRLVIGNLLGNAVKFSRVGGEVGVRIERDGTQVTLAVADSGDGIPADEIPRVFERFYRGRASGSPDVPGFGLGLALCRAVVAAYGGTIDVVSTPGKGTVFTVRVPGPTALDVGPAPSDPTAS
jgi:two-component system OmpR family sensor kinase